MTTVSKNRGMPGKPTCPGEVMNVTLSNSTTAWVQALFTDCFYTNVNEDADKCALAQYFNCDTVCYSACNCVCHKMKDNGYMGHPFPDKVEIHMTLHWIIQCIQRRSLYHQR